MLALSLLAALRPAAGSSGIDDAERLALSDGAWHKGQRGHLAFETACYFTAELPYGCQRAVASGAAWSQDAERRRQKAALWDLFAATGGRRWRASDNWAAGTDPCWDAWYGVTCDERGHIIAVELSDNRLRGRLPDSLGHLVSLLKLDLSTTARDYHGHPNLDMNQLQGAVPSLAALQRLEELELSGNELTALPSDLWQLGGSLRLLSAARNRLEAFPRNLGRFAALQTLELGENLIAEAFPPDLGVLGRLRVLQLEKNGLQGSVGREVIGLRRLQVFDVSHNPSLAGELPVDIIVEWEDQEYLSILNTSISGYLASLCLDVPFCWKFMYDTHKDLTWATAADVPDIVDITISLAQQR